MQLSTSDKQLLVAAEFSAAESFKGLARTLNQKEAFVRRNLARLITEGFIVGRTPVIDLTAFGFVEYSVFLSLVPATRANLHAFIDRLKATPSVSWIGRFHGKYELCVSFVSDTPLTLSSVIDAAATEAKVVIQLKELIVRETSAFYPRRYLAPNLRLKPGPTCGGSARKKPLDNAEKVILRTMSKHGVLSHRELSRKSNIPQTTITRKIAQMEKVGVIAGYIFRYKLQLGGQFSNFVFLTLKSRAHIRAIVDFVAACSNVNQLRQVFGSWDVELQFESDSADLTAKLVDDLFKSHGDIIVSASTAQLIESCHYCPYPL